LSICWGFLWWLLLCDCHFAYCHYTDCCYADWHYTDCYADYHYADCQYMYCQYAHGFMLIVIARSVLMALWIIWRFNKFSFFVFLNYFLLYSTCFSSLFSDPHTHGKNIFFIIVLFSHFPHTSLWSFEQWAKCYKLFTSVTYECL
jgi:hypothetical protein